MFWQMHDAMYQDQAALSEEDLKGTAKRLGLSPDGFSACLAEPATQEAVNTDSKAAQELGIGGTPYFLINGRPIYGSVPADQFETLIQDELNRKGAKRS